MEFHFNTEQERLALTGADEEIRHCLETYSEAVWRDKRSQKEWPNRFCQNEIFVTGSTHTQQAGLPYVTIDDLQNSHDDLTNFQGFWSVLWLNEAPHKDDIVYDDQFRSVIVFGRAGINFALRPLQDDPLGRKTPRLLYV